MSGKMHYLGNVPGNEHILGLPARGMQSILPSRCLYFLPSTTVKMYYEIEAAACFFVTFFLQDGSLAP